MTRGAGYFCLGAASALPFALAAPAWGAATVTITGVSATPALGKVSAPSSTVFTVAAGTGSISKSGAGFQIGGGSSVVTVTLTCTSSACNTGATGKISAVSVSGRMSSLTNFTLAAGSATGAITPTKTGSTSNSVTFTLPAMTTGSTHTFSVGMDVTVVGDNTGGLTYGPASATYLAQIAAGAATPSGTTQGSASATMLRALSIASTSDLKFGTISRPTSGTQTVTVDNTTGAISISGAGSGAAAAANTAHSRAAFTIVGEGGQSFNLSTPATLAMIAGANTLTASLTPTTSSGTTTLGPSLGSAATLTLGVGGAINISTSTPSGAYSGTFMVMVNYN